LTPRFPDVNEEALGRTVAATSESLKQFPDVDDPRNYQTFRLRAQARYAVGAPVREVVDDLRLAGLCLRREARVRLFKMEPHLLKSRRLDPLHLALLHAEPEYVEKMGLEYGLPLMQYYAGTADRHLEAEVQTMSPFFRTRALNHPKHVVGLAAATYCAALGALVRGDEKEAAAVLNMLNRAADTLAQAPPPSGKRYLLQCAALADLLSRRSDDVAQHVAALAPYADSDREKALSMDGDAVRGEGLGAPDLAIPALFGLAALMNIEVDIAPLRAVSPHLADLCAEIERAWLLIE